MSRDEAKHLAKSKGVKILSGISRNTDYLVVGDSPGNKVQKAKTLGIKILTEEEFIIKINK